METEPQMSDSLIASQEAAAQEKSVEPGVEVTAVEDQEKAAKEQNEAPEPEPQPTQKIATPPGVLNIK